MLLHLPGSHRARDLKEGLIQAFAALPASTAKSLTWGQGTEMSLHAELTATGDVSRPSLRASLALASRDE